MKPLRPFLKKTTAGYTLIEVLAVVVIIAILAAIAAPSWLAYANRQRVNAIESDLEQFLQRAQQQAIKERQAVSVEVGNTADGLPAARMDGGTAEQLGPNDLAPNTIQITLLTEESDPDTVFDFDHKGMVANVDDLPIVFSISPTNSSNIQHCVMVTSILGNIKSSRDATVCNAAADILNPE